jgi:hypothetical protein
MKEYEGDQADHNRKRYVRPVGECGRRDRTDQQITKDASAHGGHAAQNNDAKQIEMNAAGDSSPLHCKDGCRNEVERTN